MSGYAYTPWIWPVLASAAFTGAVGLYLLRRRETTGAFPLSLAAFVMSLWCLADAAEMAATSFETQRLWFVLHDALGLPGVIFALWFALEYAGFRRFLTRPVVALLVGSVIVHAPLYAIDGGRLLWSEVWWEGGIRSELNAVGAVVVVYGFGLFLLATVVMAILFVRSPAHRLPVALILLGQLAIRAVYPLGALNIAHVPNLPLIVLAFDFATLMYVIALFRLRLFDLVPVARETIIERMPDAMLVIDARGRVADCNQAACELFGASRPQVLGQPAARVLTDFPQLVRLLAEPAAAREALLLCPRGEERWCQASITPLADWHGMPIGRLVVLHEITELKRTEGRLLERQREVAVAQSREHLAWELHDSVGQLLGYVSMQVDAARKLLADGKEAEASRQLGRLADTAREAHADVRAYIEELHAATAGRQRFVDALRRELGAFTRNYGIPIELASPPSVDAVDIDQGEQTQLLRIVQEALTNARRHAAARRVRVTLEAEDSTARIVIEDDGRGFDPVAVSGDGDGRYGLRFMRERVQELNGDLEIVSAPGHGTRLEVRVPLPPAVPAAGDVDRMAASVGTAPVGTAPGSP